LTTNIDEAGKPASLAHFNNLHTNETCLLLGNGPSLNDVPLGFLDKYPTIGSNTIFMSGYVPTYYTAVDKRICFEFGDIVNERLGHIPKFIPTPNLDMWEGENFYRWHHRPGPLWPYAEDIPFPGNVLSDPGITYACVMHVQIQLAGMMGFSTLLFVGMDHTIEKREHFWGEDVNMPELPPADKWAEGYEILRKGMNVEMVNISTKSALPESIIPRRYWKNYA